MNQPVSSNQSFSPQSGKVNKWLFIVLGVVIAAAGFFGWYFYATKQPALTNQNSDSTSNAPTAGWKTYENKEYGFNFKYPSDYELSEASFKDGEMPGGVIYGLSFGPQDSEAGRHYIDLSVAKILSDPLMAPNGMSPIKTTETTIGGQKAKKYDGMITTAYVVSKNNYRYEIILLNEADMETKTNFQILLNSFQFIDTSTNETANWKNYENKELGFIFKYPLDYAIVIKKNETFLSYSDPNSPGLDQGISFSYIDKTVPELLKELVESKGIVENGSKKFANLNWNVFQYDPKNDSTATDNPFRYIYITSRGTGTFKIVADKRIGKETQTIETIKSNIDMVLSTFQFIK